MRFNSMVNITMCGGMTLEPFAKQGFVTTKIAKQDEKTGLPFNAILVTIAIYAITSLLFLIIPDIIHGITNQESPFTYKILGSVTSIILISIYILAIVTCLYQGFKKHIHLHIVEYIAFIAVL